jgi:hypothetical protein
MKLDSFFNERVSELIGTGTYQMSKIPDLTVGTSTDNVFKAGNGSVYIFEI